MKTRYEYGLPPLPGAGVDFSVDEQFQGVTSGQDRVIEALHKDGWTLHRLFTAPNAVLPLPAVKFPAGRVYLMADNVAAVVRKDNGSVIASLPVLAALQTLEQFTPEVLEENPWAVARLHELMAVEGGPDHLSEVHRRWYKQTFHAAEGARWTVIRTQDGRAAVSRDGTLVCEVADGDEADERGLHPILVELCDYVVGHP